MIEINLIKTRIPLRKLIHLCEEKYHNPNTWHIGFCYYSNDPHSGRSEFTGVSAGCHITEKELYKLLSPALIKEIRPTRRDLRRED